MLRVIATLKPPAAALVLLTLSAVAMGACSDSEEDVLDPSATAAEPSTQWLPSGSAGTPVPLTPTTVVTAGPFTYVDPTYGYSFDVPEGWYVADYGGDYLIVQNFEPRAAGHGGLEPGLVKVDIFVKANPEELSTANWLELWQDSPLAVISRVPISTDGVEGIAEMVEGYGGISTSHFFAVGDRVYVIALGTGEGADLSGFEAILNSFSFAGKD